MNKLVATRRNIAEKQAKEGCIRSEPRTYLGYLIGFSGNKRMRVEEIEMDVDVKVIDLASFCPKRKRIIETGKWSRRKEELEIRCLECD